MSTDGVAPPGWEHSVERMKRHGDIDNPFALAWWLRRTGAKPSRHDADAEFEAEVASAKALAANRSIPQVCYEAARGDRNACYLLLNATGKIYIERP